MSTVTRMLIADRRRTAVALDRHGPAGQSPHCRRRAGGTSEHPNAAAFPASLTDMMQDNFDTFRELLAADVVWHEAGNSQPVRGRDAVMETFAGLEDSGLEFEDELREVLTNGKLLMALIDARIRRGNEVVGYPVVEVARLREGEIAERWAFMDAVPADMVAFFVD